MGSDFETLLAELLGVGNERVCMAGEAIFRQGDSFKSLIYIVSGTAKLVSITETGEALWIGFAETGNFLGEAAFFSGSDHNYEASAETMMRIVSINTSRLNRVLQRNPKLNSIIARGLAKKYNRFVHQHIQVTTLSVRDRVYIELIRRAIPNGLDPSEHIIRPVPVFSRLGASG